MMPFKRYKINRRVLEDLEQRSTPGMYFYIVITAVVLCVNGFYQRHLLFSVLFASAMAIITGFRLAQFHMFRVIYDLSRKFNYMAFFASVYATSLTWGVGFAYFMLHPNEHASQIVMIASTVGLTAGGVMAFFPAWHVSVIYTLLMLGPAFVLMLWYAINLPLAFLIFLYALYMPVMALRGNREYWNALENEHYLMIRSEEIKKLSRTDGLTGLYNRRYFEEIFARQWKAALRNKSYLSLIIGDIDHFKNINDTHGHQAGDAFLQEVASLLRGTLKRETDFIARYGGEEFVILTLNTGPEETRLLAEKIRKKFEKMQIDYNGKSIKTTISLGAVSCIPDLHDKREQVLKKADEALYRAKDEGRNKMVF
jgi:diguanylate cyclase (GGDEF)-like protein